MWWSPKEHVALFHNVIWTIPSATHFPRHFFMYAWECCGAAYLPPKTHGQWAHWPGMTIAASCLRSWISPWFLLSPTTTTVHGQIGCTKLICFLLLCDQWCGGILVWLVENIQHTAIRAGFPSLLLLSPWSHQKHVRGNVTRCSNSGQYQGHHYSFHLYITIDMVIGAVMFLGRLMGYTTLWHCPGTAYCTGIEHWKWCAVLARSVPVDATCSVPLWANNCGLGWKIKQTQLQNIVQHSIYNLTQIYAGISYSEQKRQWISI